MSKVLILGATGSLGRYVTQQAVAAHHEVSVLVRSPSKLPAGIRERIVVHQADLLTTPVSDLATIFRHQDAVISTAGLVTEGQRFVDLVARVVAGLESLGETDRPVCWFLAGAALLDLDDRGRRAVDFPRVAATYWPHRANFERIRQTALDWRLLCPGPMVDQPALGLARMRISLDRLPVRIPRATGFLPGALALPFFVHRIPEMIVPYPDAAALILANLTPSGEMSRRRVGLALPAGMRGTKARWAAEPEEAQPIAEPPRDLARSRDIVMVPHPTPPDSGRASVSKPIPPMGLVAKRDRPPDLAWRLPFPVADARRVSGERPATSTRRATMREARVDSARIGDRQPRGRWPRLLLCGGILSCVLTTSLPAQSPAPRVAVVLDQEAPRFGPQVATLEREIQGFFRPGEITLLPPRAGDGTSVGVRRALDRALSDSSIAAVVALGPIGSHLLAHAGEPRKPAIAATIVDAGWQKIPQKDGTSGVRNLAYVDESYALSGTIADFHRMIPFHRMAVLIDPDLLGAIPELAGNVRYLVSSAGAGAVVIPARGTADQVLAALPDGIDAVYLTPNPALSERETARLIAGLSARRLPTLSHTADEVAAGALASYEPPEHWLRRARRVAVDLQRILAGEDAGTLPVQLVGAPRLTLNLATARAIGFSPGYSTRTNAELVGTDSLGPADTVSLADAMRGAVVANLSLRAADLGVASGAQDVRLYRSDLLPYVESRFGGTVTREETASASLSQQPQRQLDGGISFAVPLYSEQTWADYGSERRRQQGREAGREQTRLDVVLDAAQTYINVLQARTLAEVRRSNLYRNRSNLETARVRESVGSTSRADLYRWQGEVANARRDLIAAESQVQVAVLALKRVLNRPLDRPLAEQPVTLGDPALLARDSTVLTWFGDPARYAVLTRFLVGEALRVSPELARADAAIAATDRQRTAAGRAFWMPTLTLQGGLDNVFDRDGAGSSGSTLPGGIAVGTGPDFQWQFRVQASLPLFTGLERPARRSQANLDLEQLKVERADAAQAVEQRVRAALETAASSYAAIALTREASDAASRNYELVSDAYARGTASITALIDAQNAAESAAEASANAVHDFLLDLMRVERAMGDFGALRSAEQQQAFLKQLHNLEEQR